MTLHKNYSRLTLRLRDPSLNNLFWEFTNEEILLTMPYFTLIAGVFLLTNILLGEKLGFVIIVSFTFMLNVGVHIIGKRY